MSYRQPQFMIDHPAASRSISDFTMASFSDGDKRSVIDYRSGELATSSPASTADSFRIDFGAGIDFEQMIIPAGHNILDGAGTVTLFSDNDVGFGSPLNRGATLATSSLIVCTVSGGPAAERYWQVNITGASTAWEVGEFWFGDIEALSSAAAVQPEFRAPWQSQTVDVDYPGGTASLELSPPRRSFTLEVMDLDPAGADFALLDKVASAGTSKPFWYYPPDDVDTPGPYLVKLDRDATIEQDFKAPSIAVRYTVGLQMIEQKL